MKSMELKDLEQAGGAPATKGPAATSTATTYSVELTKTPIGLGLSLTDDVVTDIKPDSQAARDGRVKVGDRVVTVNGEAPTKAKSTSTILATSHRNIRNVLCSASAPGIPLTAYSRCVLL